MGIITSCQNVVTPENNLISKKKWNEMLEMYPSLGEEKLQKCYDSYYNDFLLAKKSIGTGATELEKSKLRTAFSKFLENCQVMSLVREKVVLAEIDQLTLEYGLAVVNIVDPNTDIEERMMFYFSLYDVNQGKLVAVNVFCHCLALSLLYLCSNIVI